MGIRAHFTVITEEDLRQITEGGNPSLEGGRKYRLEKSWTDFQTIFSAFEPPLDKTIVGDTKHPQETHSIEMRSHDFYCGFVSVPLVQTIATKLNSIDDEQILCLYRDANVAEHDPDLYFFGQLKAAYSDAASESNALMILIA